MQMTAITLSIVASLLTIIYVLMSIVRSRRR